MTGIVSDPAMMRELASGWDHIDFESIKSKLHSSTLSFIFTLIVLPLIVFLFRSQIRALLSVIVLTSYWENASTVSRQFLAIKKSETYFSLVHRFSIFFIESWASPDSVPHQLG